MNRSNRHAFGLRKVAGSARPEFPFLFLACMAIGVAVLVWGGCVFSNDSVKDAGARQVYFGLAVHGLPQEPAELRDMEKETGLPVSMVNVFLQWPKDPAEENFPGETLEAVHRFGAIACITWEPLYYDDLGRERSIPAGEILQGEYDAYIDRFAAKASDWGQPVIIRFAHEMNLERYHWGADRSRYGPGSPERYRRMFRYVADRFRTAGAEKALFAFCPNAESIPHPERDGADWNRPGNYYPGDEYVDVLGMDGYNWGSTRSLDEHGWKSEWRTFEEIFAPIYRQLREINPDKPLFVFETAAPEKGGDRDLWVRQAFETASKWNIQGLFWFQANKETDWRLQAGPDSRYPGAVRREMFSPGPFLEQEH